MAGNICKQHSLEEGCDGAISFEGVAELVTDQIKLKEVLPYFTEQLGRGEDILEEAKNSEGHQFYKIEVSAWWAYGKFDGDKSAKYKLVV